MPDGPVPAGEKLQKPTAVRRPLFLIASSNDPIVQTRNRGQNISCHRGERWPLFAAALNPSSGSRVCAQSLISLNKDQMFMEHPSSDLLFCRARRAAPLNPVPPQRLL